MNNKFGYGKTIGTILEIIGRAMQSPGISILYRTIPENENVKQNKEEVESLIGQIGLKKIIVLRQDRDLYIRSEWYGFIKDGIDNREATIKDWK